MDPNNNPPVVPGPPARPRKIGNAQKARAQSAARIQLTGDFTFVVLFTTIMLCYGIHVQNKYQSFGMVLGGSALKFTCVCYEIGAWNKINLGTQQAVSKAAAITVKVAVHRFYASVLDALLGLTIMGNFNPILEYVGFFLVVHLVYSISSWYLYMKIADALDEFLVTFDSENVPAAIATAFVITH